MGYFNIDSANAHTFNQPLVCSKVNDDTVANSPCASFIPSPSSSASSNLQSGYLRTGDLGLQLGGWLYLTGRLKELMILRGRNIYPHDVELAVEACAAVRPGCTAAFLVPVEGDGTEEALGIAAEIRLEMLTEEIAKLARKPKIEKDRRGSEDQAPATNHIAVGLRRMGLGLPLRRSSVSTASDRTLALSSIAEQVCGFATAAVGMPVTALWLLTPRTISKTSSGKIQRSRTRDRLLRKETTKVLYLHLRVGRQLGQAPPTLCQTTKKPEAAALTPSRPSLSNTRAAIAAHLSRSKFGGAPFKTKKPSTPQNEAQEQEQLSATLKRSQNYSKSLSREFSPPPQGLLNKSIQRSATVGAYAAASTHTSGNCGAGAAAGLSTTELSVLDAVERLVLNCVHSGLCGGAAPSSLEEGLVPPAEEVTRLLDDPLLQVGLDSIGVVEVADALGSLLGLTLDPTLLFEQESLRHLIRFIVQRLPDGLLRGKADKRQAHAQTDTQEQPATPATAPAVAAAGQAPYAGVSGSEVAVGEPMAKDMFDSAAVAAPSLPRAQKGHPSQELGLVRDAEEIGPPAAAAPGLPVSLEPVSSVLGCDSSQADPVGSCDVIGVSVALPSVAGSRLADFMAALLRAGGAERPCLPEGNPAASAPACANLFKGRVPPPPKASTHTFSNSSADVSNDGGGEVFLPAKGVRQTDIKYALLKQVVSETFASAGGPTSVGKDGYHIGVFIGCEMDQDPQLIDRLIVNQSAPAGANFESHNNRRPRSVRCLTDLRNSLDAGNEGAARSLGAGAQDAGPGEATKEANGAQALSVGDGAGLPPSSSARSRTSYSDLLSFHFNLLGPSVTMGVSSSSGLAPLHCAMRELQSGKCDAALVGSVSAVSPPLKSAAPAGTRTPEVIDSVRTSRGSIDRRTEQCAVAFLLQRASALKATPQGPGAEVAAAAWKGTTVALARVLASTLQHAGRETNHRGPGVAAQRCLLESALVGARLLPNRIDFVEADGTGWTDGHIQELPSLSAVFGNVQAAVAAAAAAAGDLTASYRRLSKSSQDGGKREGGVDRARGAPRRAPLVVGTLKSSLGDLGAVSGLAGFVKAIGVAVGGTVPGDTFPERLTTVLKLHRGSRFGQLVIPVDGNLSLPSLFEEHAVGKAGSVNATESAACLSLHHPVKERPSAAATVLIDRPLCNSGTTSPPHLPPTLGNANVTGDQLVVGVCAFGRGGAASHVFLRGLFPPVLSRLAATSCVQASEARLEAAARAPAQRDAGICLETIGLAPSGVGAVHGPETHRELRSG
eukprot:GHVT01041798.1.p1 GENE.GHVT01041798.1~~GHVT01041798.1.p1  ORF type:complete len:1287 (-),score=271.81 GHVT01041798.1:3214-7074(-)